MKKIKNNKVVFIGVAIVLIIIVGVISYNPIRKMVLKNKLENRLVEIVTNYYDNDFSKYFPFQINDDEITFTIKDLQIFGIDVSEFIENNCDIDNTKAKLVFKNGKYKTSTTIDCKL